MSKSKSLVRYEGIALLLALILLFTIQRNLCAQNAEVIQINSIPQEGLLLDKGWKFFAGDHPDFASPDFDDREWESINPTLDVRDALPQIPVAGICWFRMHLKLESTLLEKQLSLGVFQVGASEIFVNGNMIQQYGVVSKDPEKVETYIPWEKPLLFPVEVDSEIILSVRYSREPNSDYLKAATVTVPALSIRLNHLEDAISAFTRESSRQMNSTVFRIGLFLMLSILHFAFFLSYPSQKANLYFSLFALIVIGSETNALASINGINAPNSIERYYHSIHLWNDLFPISNFFLLTAFYTLFDRRKDWIYWMLIGTIVVNIFGNFYFRWVWEGVLLFNSIVYSELLRISFIAVKNKMRGSLIIAIGALLYLICFIAFILGIPFDYMNTHISPTYTMGDLLYNFQYLSIPIATSIYLGLDFAYTSVSLKQKLTEVELLSSKTIDQEREKQQILASINETLEKQVSERTAELSQSINHLKATQAQLIQSEKMASLGELTAGIAHEIQNPLNFVNNFSEVNTELVDELKKELAIGNRQLAEEIAVDIKENSEKINHHGKRADAIVKGMLQHSRSSSGQKELTDINALCDEYLRLAYHGYRAKDKSFNAKFETHLDPTLPKLNVVAQDIGRVILNLINNAFYAVNERQKAESLKPDSGYEPTVIVSTEHLGEKIEISVKDNGSGIPDSIKEKIFQPFFTTKPTGQGTGLGLSLSYDIVKAHNGEIKVKTNEGEGTEFIISLIV